MYPDEHFIEKPVKEAMKKFRKNLDEIVSSIAERNRNKKLPYYYLSPDQIPNSVAVWAELCWNLKQHAAAVSGCVYDIWRESNSEVNLW